MNHEEHEASGIADVVRALRIGLVGEEAAEVRIGQRRYDLVVRLAATASDSANAIRNLRLEAHDGTRVPLEQVARIEQVLAPGTIRREGGNRRIAVEAIDGEAAACAGLAAIAAMLPAGERP